MQESHKRLSGGAAEMNSKEIIIDRRAINGSVIRLLNARSLCVIQGTGLYALIPLHRKKLSPKILA